MTEYPKYDNSQISEEYKAADFDCKCRLSTCKITLVDRELLTALDRLVLVIPIVRITSGFRCEAHNKTVGGAGNSLHLVGKAVDVTSPFARPKELRAEAEKISTFYNGGIGLYADHLHLDTRGEKARW